MSTLSLLSIVDYHKMLHSNLKLICQIFPNCEMAKCDLEADMFKKPNNKMMYSVFYSIIFILSPEKCRNLLPWPAVYKADTYKFKSGIFKFIEDEFVDFNSPKIAYSLINAASGDRFVQFLHRFCLHAMKCIISKYYGINLLERVIHLPMENKSLIRSSILRMELEEKKKAEEFEKFFEFFERNAESMLKEFDITANTITEETSILADRISNIPEEIQCNRELLMDLSSEQAISEWFGRLRLLQATVEEREKKIIKDLELINELINLLNKRDDLLKILLDGFDVDIELSNYTLDIIQVQRQEVTDVLCTNGKLSVEKLLRLGLIINKKYIEQCTELEPPDRYYDIMKVLKDKIAATKEDMKCFEELNDEVKIRIDKKRQSVAYLRGKVVNNLTKDDVQLYTNLTSGGSDFSFELKDEYVKSLPNIIEHFNSTAATSTNNESDIETYPN